MTAAALFLPEKCTGADILSVIAALAERLGIEEHVLIGRLSRYPSKWKQQVSVAQRPKPHTIERVRALLSGEVIPAPPPNNFQSRDARSGRGGKAAEAEVLRRYDVGQPPKRIMAETGIHPAIVRRALSLTGDSEMAARRADCTVGSEKLREAIRSECAARERRRRKHEAARADAARPKSFEEQLALVAAGKLAIAPTLARTHLEPRFHENRKVA